MVDVAEVNSEISIQVNDRLASMTRHVCPNQDCESNQGSVQRFFINLRICPFCEAVLKKVSYMVPY